MSIFDVSDYHLVVAKTLLKHNDLIKLILNGQDMKIL